ncbi:toll/interleukin-1 receptor domain-containing protein [Micromonospora sp. CV4]|uniref:toll/interleukin-1 receptor domain-containing protein n=1 Tax=Micromonospora sp. CV4 TaxID=2478711 RepID=UPI001315243F|nr:toll/interleukin-1 receptor domain-containing protein [Micromonospora sp. CV4]
MSEIFINYRSDDDSYAAPLLDNHLRTVFGDGNVFKDSRSIEAGTDFPPRLWSALMGSRLLLVLIGKRWLTLTDASSRRRIDHPDDYVRREIEAALLAGIRVIPVLLDGAKLPRVDDLPVTVRGLTTRQAMHLRQRESEIDLPAIVNELSKWVRPIKGTTEGVPDQAAPSAARGNFGSDGVYFERGGTYIKDLHGNADVVSGDKNVYGGTP